MGGGIGGAEGGGGLREGRLGGGGGTGSPYLPLGGGRGSWRPRTRGVAPPVAGRLPECSAGVVRRWSEGTSSQAEIRPRRACPHGPTALGNCTPTGPPGVFWMGSKLVEPTAVG